LADKDDKKPDDKGNDKTVTIMVNQDEHRVTKEKISYEDVVALYLGDGGAASVQYLIKYSRGHSANVSGTLMAGNSVKVKDGMRFRVSGAGES
tara:strand:- start:1005 stop:1283 length:279 start_codon:yes stop_codon:yes gene_type:complete